MRLTKEKIEGWSNEAFPSVSCAELTELLRGYKAMLAEVKHHEDEQKLLRMELQSTKRTPDEKMEIRVQLGWHSVCLDNLQGGAE